MTATPTVLIQEVKPQHPQGRTNLGATFAYLGRNPNLTIGLLLLLVLILIGLIGPLFVNVANAQPTSVMPDQAPSTDLPLGSDDQGRDLLAVLVAGLPLTLRIGFIAGAVGLFIGIILGFVAGYSGGIIDTVIRTFTDTLLTVPGLLVLVIIADSIKGVISVTLMALIVACLAWRQPARVIRSQVLSLRERGYVQMARLSGVGAAEIIVRELIPNMLPYLAASFVGAVSAAILSAIGLEAIGLGPQNDPTIGMTIYWSINFNALIRGLWWWWLMPIVVIVVLFSSLFLIAAGFDEIANPRLRRAA
jgi:peptide/nickel transport system permease protein